MTRIFWEPEEKGDYSKTGTSLDQIYWKIKIKFCSKYCSFIVSRTTYF